MEAFAVEYNEKRRQELLDLGRDSTYFFAQAILGMKDLEAKPHLDLCENLDGRGEWGAWNRAMVCAARGYFKSSIASIAWPLHQAIYQMNWSARLIGSSHNNVRDNFFRKMLRLCRDGERRNLFLWLYQDRIRGDFEGWTDDQIVFIAEDPMAAPSITYKGIDSSHEGYHGDCLIFDDPEGADADKSRVANIDAEAAIDNAPPLLINPNEGQILVVVTPWGGNPLAYKLKDRKGWKVWWMPIVDGEGKPTWPARYPEAAVNSLRLTTASKTWRSQYLLEKPAEGTSLFDWNAIKAGMYKWKVPGQIIEYPAIMVDKKKMDLGEEGALKVVTRKIDVSLLRFYQHVDFIHRMDTVSTKMTGTARPSKMAIVIVGVAPDFHAFVMGYKTERLDLDQQVDAVYNYYRTWAPFEVTFDAVGAQHWFLGIAQMKERSDLRYRAIESAGKYGIRRQLPALSSRLVEDKRSARIAKEDAIHERLEPWLSGAVLHIHDSQDELITQLKGFPDAVEYVDLVDALAQGPNVWKPGLGQDGLDRQKKAELQIVRAEHTGYFSPFAQKKKK